MTPYIEIHITTDSQSEAQRIGTKLVQERLAACAQISGPIQSIYEWEEKIENSEEWVLSLKSHQEFFPRLVEVIRKEHSYKCPQIIALPLVNANEDYLAWMKAAINTERKS